MPRQRLSNFLNNAGQVTQWPAKYSVQELVLAYISEKFSFEQTYTEQEVNAVLKSWHTFGDWAILRRALVDGGYMRRGTGGHEYRRLK